MKVLPKFHGPLHRLEAPLQKVAEWARGPELPCPRVAAKAERMLQRLRETGHASFV